jgi:hypothetical protein
MHQEGVVEGIGVGGRKRGRGRGRHRRLRVRHCAMTRACGWRWVCCVLCVVCCVCEGEEEGEKKWEGKGRPVRLECSESRRDVDAGK